MPVLTAPTVPTHHLHGTSFTSLATPSRGTTAMSVWQVEIAPGTPATPHSMTLEEVFVVLAGSASVVLGGVPQSAEAGDAIVVPPGVEFELSTDGPGPLRLLCCLPVGGEARLSDGTTFVPPWSE